MNELDEKHLLKSSPPELPDYFVTSEHLNEEQIQRKLRSERILHEQGVRINPHLPCTESTSETKPRKTVEVYQRFVALTLVATCAWERGQGDPNGDIDELISGIIDERNAWDWLTDRERAFLRTPDSDPNENLQLSWRYEAALPLQWALGAGADALDSPVDACDVAALCASARDDIELADGSLRDASSLLNEADLIFRYHWAVRQSSLDGEEPGGNLYPGVVMERHHALNWLTCHSDVDWEDVSTDT
ncbi:MAG: DUF4272 domain-containing protein [Pseudomonadota bacterium]